MARVPQREFDSVYFDDPRLRMTIPGRFVVRVAAYVTYLVLLSAALVFLTSDLMWIRLLGVGIALFLADRLLRIGEADRPLIEMPKEGLVNLASYMRPRAFSVIEAAFDRGVITGRNVFLEAVKELLTLPEIFEALRRIDVTPESFRKKLEEFLETEKHNSYASKQELLSAVDELARESYLNACFEEHRFIETADIFAALAGRREEVIQRLFHAFEISPDDVNKALIFSSVGPRRTLGRIPRALGGFTLGGHRRIRHRIMNRAWTSRPTPTLDQYSVDFTDLARMGDIGFLIGHASEYERLVTTLARPINPNALLAGDVGVGKETVLHRLALALSKDEVPPALFDRRLVSLELGNLVAGAPPEELHKRLTKIVEEIVVAGNIILYIPNIHNLVKTSGTAYISAADALMPIIMNNDFPVVGTSSPREFKEYIEPRGDFAGAFEIIRVEEISESDAEKLLTYSSVLLEREFGVTVSFGAVRKAVALAKKYFHAKHLPSSAEEILKSALVEAQKRGEKVLGPDAITRAAEEKINIPMHEAGEKEAEKLLHLEDIIHERMVDQEEAVRAVAEALREYRSGLARRGGPIASFLFIGPTGVGKTELAKTLAKTQFGSEKLMARFDMTEYQDKQSFFRFIGSPDGRVSGALTDAVLEKPYSLILLDEFEKAYPDILALFLQVFDDGRLTDNLGRTVDFTNTIIIATSNAHSDIVNEALRKGESMADIAQYLKTRLVDVFKPELLNRFTRIVVFKNLEPQHLEKVAALNLKEVAEAIGEQGVSLVFDESVVRYLARAGYDPVFGARPLRRVIDEKLRSPLSKKILVHALPKGSKFIAVLKGEEVDFVPMP